MAILPPTSVGGGVTVVGYDQITASVSIASVTEATGTTIISCAAHTFDGSLVCVEFFTPRVTTPLASGANQNNSLTICLFEGATQITRLGWALWGEAGLTFTPSGQTALLLRHFFTPTAASHTYTVTAFANNVTGPPSVQAGSGGTGGDAPCYVRFTTGG